jgi:hypothetical protein
VEKIALQKLTVGVLAGGYLNLVAKVIALLLMMIKAH